MVRNKFNTFACIFLLGLALPLSAYAVMGDVDGSGIVDVDDARCIARFLVNEIPALPEPGNADVTQDGKTNMEDSFAIAKYVAGQSQITVVASRYGQSGKLQIGDTIRIEVFEKFCPFGVTGGNVRIRSDSTGYDSGDQPLTFEHDGRSLYYHWNTSGLEPASDYEITVSLATGGSLSFPIDKLFYGITAETADAVVTLTDRVFEPPFLAAAVDAFAPAPGIPHVFRRVFPHYSAHYPYLGPLGRGWVHNYDICLEEYTDGRVAFHGPEGFNRFFESNADGTYTSSPGDYGILTRDPDGTFQLKEKNGLIYHFRTDLRLDYEEDLNGNRITAIYDGENRLVEIYHSCGQSFYLQYNEHGRLISLTDHAGRVTNYEYWPESTTDFVLTKVTDPAGSITEYVYHWGQSDVLNYRLREIAFPDGTHVHYEYDTQTRLIRQTGTWGANPISYIYDANGTTHITDALGGETTIRVNEHGQPTEICNPLGANTCFDYDSAYNLSQITDPCGHSYSLIHDPYGNIIQIAYPDGNAVNFDYDLRFNTLAWLEDSLGHITTFEYDPNGNLLRTTYLDTSTEEYTYDSNGNISSKKNRSGEIISYLYKTSGQLIQRDFPDGNSTYYVYDANGNMTLATDEATIITMSYDELDRLTHIEYPGGFSFDYEYDGMGKRTRRTDQDGREIYYEYDVTGRLVRTYDQNDATIVCYEYDWVGRRTKKTLGNGVYTTYEYDALGQLLHLINYDPNDTIISRFDYTYDAVGNRLTKETIEGVESYIYDSLNQVIAVTYPDATTEEFVYDSMGSRLIVRENGIPITYTVNNLDQYTAVGAVTYSYDDSGNLTSKNEGGQTTYYHYDYENRLVRVETPNEIVSYAYGPFGLRHSRSDSNSTVRYLWDGYQVAVEQNEANDIVASYVWGDILDEAICMRRGGSDYYYTQDALLSVSDLTGVSGNPVEHYRYRLFGEPLVESTMGNPWLFTGLASDSKTDLQYSRYRYYSPNIGRFTTVDPIGMIGEINLYSYANNSPAIYSDPLGLWLVDIDAGVVSIWFGRDPKTGKKGFGIGAGPGLGIYFSKEAYPIAGGTVAATGALGKGRSYGGTLFPEGRWTWPMPESKYSVWGLGGGLSLGGTFTWGGTCPTFIQLPHQAKRAQPQDIRFDISKKQLVGMIQVPISDCLLRSDIPIFGIAGGTDFKKYRVEYGKGSDPTKWYLIRDSNQPQQTCPEFKDISWMQGDIDIRGNLATWNTGLKNWFHLPWHPPEDSTDLNGVYTIRLVVEGKDGKIIEDRVTCEVGRVIAQCLPGIAISPDKRVVMHFPEQALTHPFRVYTILPLPYMGDNTPEPPTSCKFISPVYRIREPGDKFAKDVKLEFNLTKTETKKTKVNHIGICRYDVQNKKWIWLQTTHNNTTTVSTTLTELPAPEAIYALAYDPKAERSSPAQEAIVKKPAEPVRPGVLMDCSFEKDLGTFQPRDHFIGAALERDRKATPDGSHCLKLTNINHGGNFSCTVLDQPFDVRKYRTMSFDYRVGPEVKIDFLLKVNGRWYWLRFTGDEIDYRFRDVNIENIGEISGILTDNKWHTASIDLRRLLRQQTRHTRIDEIIMANWNVGGYMKLQFGSNPRGATFYIDNFKLAGSGSVPKNPPILLVDDFDSGETTNALGVASGAYCTPGTRFLESSIVQTSSEKEGSSDSASLAGDQELQLEFDMRTLGAYGGYWTSLKGRDLSDYNALKFQLRAQNSIPPMHVGIRSKTGAEGRASIIPYAVSSGEDSLWDLRIPLSAIRGLADFYDPDVLFFGVSNKENSGKATVWIDDMRLESEPIAKVSDFEPPLKWNYLGGEYSTHKNGAAAISASSMPDVTQRPKANNTVYCISYGGSIGRDYGPQGGFSYCSWRCNLNGFDARSFKYLALKIRGEKGGETPNIYLHDSAKRIALRAKEMPQIKQEWQKVILPLEHFTKQGIDTSFLESLELVFEWTEQSGSIYIDDIMFE
jgi:RHS repeat-associated protein